MEEGGEGRDIVGAGSLHVIDDGGGWWRWVMKR